MSDELADEDREHICDALYAGRKIEAIKIYREATGQGLTEAKDFIDALVPRLKEEHPEKFAAKRSGCAGVVLLLVLAPGMAWLCLVSS